ncbi:MAG: hypothetical protein JWL61_4151 [Gemmatimonadetes bacterium]|nr:hypothetical protein [Gemmatimonadota bacterium]
MLSFTQLRSARRTQRRITIAATLAIVSATLYACRDAVTSVDDDPDGLGAGIHREYGAPIAIGNGHARSYINIDTKNGNTPLEIGVTFEESAMEGLPMDMGSHGGHAGIDLPLPAQNPTSYKLVELDWNPMGHEPATVYDQPHFDFHFYTISAAERNAIDPVTLGDVGFQTKASNLPTAAERFAFYVPVAPPEGPVVAVPYMGVHWADLRAPELQGAFGHPENAKLFTTTILHGSWDGRFIFDEPMVTRAFIMGRKTAVSPASRDSVMALSSAQQYRNAAYRPDAYRVTYDAQAREYRIALTQLKYRQ